MIKVFIITIQECTTAETLTLFCNTDWYIFSIFHLIMLVQTPENKCLDKHCLQRTTILGLKHTGVVNDVIFQKILLGNALHVWYTVSPHLTAVRVQKLQVKCHAMQSVLL